MSRPQSERGLSPVVGVVLLVAIATLLAGVATVVVFGATEKKEPAPEVRLELESTSGPVAHELVMEGGDDLRGEKVRFRGTADETPLTGTLVAGERLWVYPVEETVEVVWFGEYDTSYVLATFEPETELSSEHGNCNRVITKTIDFVVNCNVIQSGDVDIVDPGVVIGDVDSRDNNVDIDHGAVYGTVAADSAVDLDGATVAADVTAGGDVTVTDGSTVSGSITTGSSGSIDVDGGSTVRGSLSAGDDIALDSVTVKGDVNGPDVDIADSTIAGSVVGTSVVQLDGVTVSGHVYAPSGSFSCTDSTINGQDCSSYTPRDPDDY